MGPTQPAARLRPDAKAASLTLDILGRLFGDRPRAFGVRLWDGTEMAASEPPQFTLVLNHPAALRRMFLPPTELTISEAFLRGDFDVEGNLEASFGLAETMLERVTGTRDRLDLARMLASLPRSEGTAAIPSRRADLRGRRHSLARDRQAVTHHYDVGNDYFRLWLDRRLVYSCAYFEHADQPLDAAQEAKLNLICRKLCLRRGERFLDIGCGWGALVVHAAQHYGVNATGITLSRPQAELANRRIAAAGLAGCARVEVRDVESLREHYALTLRHWVHRLEAQHDPALQYVDEPTYRAWRLFMSGSPHGFTTGRLNVYQALLVKPGEHGASGLPLTRRDWYQLQGNSRTT